MKAGKTILSIVTLTALFFIQSCQKETKKTETINEEIATAPNSGAAAGATLTAPQVYGVWHAGKDQCIWGSVRDTNEFRTNNYWIIDRGDGTGRASVSCATDSSSTAPNSATGFAASALITSATTQNADAITDSKHFIKLV